MACVVAVLIWIASIDNPLYTPGEYSHGNGGTGMLKPVIYLYWEGEAVTEFDMSHGFVVPGAQTGEFLCTALSRLGLTPKEYNEFIVYWLPKIQENPYNLITFQQEAYTQSAKLEITPEPDSILRVFMVYQALEEPMEVPEQTLEPFTRTGFTVVEWGGAELTP